MAESLVTKTIKEQLIEKRYREDQIDLINFVACEINNGISDLGLLYAYLMTEDFSNPRRIIIQQGRILQSVNILVEEGYVRLHRGMYILTEKGNLSFEQ